MSSITRCIIAALIAGVGANKQYTDHDMHKFKRRAMLCRTGKEQDCHTLCKPRWFHQTPRPTVFNICKDTCEYVKTNFGKKVGGRALTNCARPKHLATRAGIVFLRGANNNQIDAVQNGCELVTWNNEACAEFRANAAEDARDAAADAALEAADNAAADLNAVASSSASNAEAAPAQMAAVAAAAVAADAAYAKLTPREQSRNEL